MDDGATLDDRTLRRIIALLVALAGLGECAAVRSFPVRWLVLFFLRRAEPVARDFVIETAPWAWPYLEDALEPGNSPAHALLLGRYLRLLAAVLSALLPPAESPDGWTAGRNGAPFRRPSRPGFRPAMPGFALPQPHDTS